MRITLVATNGYTHDRRARALARQCQDAGHDVTVVALGAAADDPRVVAVPTRRPAGPGPLRARLRRWRSAEHHRRRARRDLIDAVVVSAPDLVVPTTAAAVDVAVDAAVAADVPVTGDIRLELPRAHDLRWRPGADDGPHPSAGAVPRAGRHAGTRIVLAYRKRAASPGRWLHEALDRAGVEVLVVEDRLDHAALPDGLAGVVVVESPYPALTVVGPPASVPVVHWVHHGEHHLDANVRLARRFGADRVLLAHSWHLAHRFGVPTTRFPFAAPFAAGTFPPVRPWDERRHDVAMVGSHLDGGGPYARRGALVAAARAHLGEDRCAFRSGITPDEMLGVYADSRVVLNEGGTRHHPVTMRVFEAVGSGALLLTDPAPGLDDLLPHGGHVEIGDDLADDLDRVLGTPTASASAAAAGRAHLETHHTYDHRVDELLAVLRATPAVGRRRPDPPDTATLAGAVADDVHVQVLVQHGAPDVAHAHPDREVWSPDELGDRLRPGAVEAAVVRTDLVDDTVATVLDAGWRYLYVDGAAVGLEQWLDRHHPGATTTTHGSVRRVDLHAAGYTVSGIEGARS